MEYQIDNADHIIDYWLPAFEAISLKQFENFWELLGFPFKPTHELRGITKDFALLVFAYLGVDIPASPSVAMQFSTDEIDPLIQIWTWTFSRLQALDYADKINAWVQKTVQFPLDASLPQSFPTDWDLFLIDWAHDPSGFLPLNFSHKLAGKLQLIVIKYETKHYEIRFQIKEVEETPGDSWEQYAFKRLVTGSWINNHAQYRNELSKWSEIFSTLSIHELETLDKWGYENFQAVNIAKNYFSLTQFAAELNKSS
jgi:hypothetical protein